MTQGKRESPLAIFWLFLRLGLTSFGGPVAHIGYFREEVVVRKGWLSEEEFADLAALSQFLPGPASSQVGMGVGAIKGGLLGVLAAWVGFTLPSALIMILFAFGVDSLGSIEGAGWIRGLKAAAVAVVAQAVWGMAVQLCPDRQRGTLALLSAVLVLSLPGVLGQSAAIVLGAGVGFFFFRPQGRPDAAAMPREIPVSKTAGALLLSIFFLLLVGLPLAARLWGEEWLIFINGFYRSGALIFGGGHVVLPLLEAEFVPTGWVGRDLFLAGYGAAQALPGPLLAFSAYLGGVMSMGPQGAVGGVLAVGMIFLPSLLLVPGALPFWNALRGRLGTRAALTGINASVVGLLLAALYEPVFTGGVHGAADFCLVLLAFGLGSQWKFPPWLVVALSALGGALFLT